MVLGVRWVSCTNQRRWGSCRYHSRASLFHAVTFAETKRSSEGSARSAMPGTRLRVRAARIPTSITSSSWDERSQASARSYAVDPGAQVASAISAQVTAASSHFVHEVALHATAANASLTDISEVITGQDTTSSSGSQVDSSHGAVGRSDLRSGNHLPALFRI